MTAGLVILGVWTTPGFFLAGASSWVGTAAVLAILLAYAAAGFSRLALGAASRIALPSAMPLGLAAGAVYASEIGFEYALRPEDNTAWGLIEFGAVFALCLIAGTRTGLRDGRVWPAALAGAWTAVIGSLIWYGVLLAVTYAFRGTDAEATVFRAEGDLEDFRRSGTGDFNIFIMQDFLGAGFFHLLLAPLLGLALGAAGAIPALLIRRRENKST